MSYLGPDSMELPDEQQPPPSFVITPGIPDSLKLALLGKIKPGDTITVFPSDGKKSLPMEVFDTDGEGSVLWQRAGLEGEERTERADLYSSLEAGIRVKVEPR